MSILIKVVSAQLSRDTEFFSNMDPYCILKLGSQSQRTRTKDEAGKKPVWNESFRFNNQDNALKVTVMDEDGVSDDMVGQGNVDLSKFRNSPAERQEIVQLYYQGKAAGKVLLKISGSGTQPNNNTFGQGNTWGNQQQQGNQWGGNQQNNQWGNQPQPNQQWGNTQPQNNQWGMQQNNNFGNQPQVNPYGNQNNGWGAQQGSSWNQPVNPNIAPNVVPNANQWGQNSNQQNQWGNPNTVNPNTPPVNPNTPVNPNNPYPSLQYNNGSMGGNNAVNPLLLMGQTLQANGGFGGMSPNQPYTPPPNQYNNSNNNYNNNNSNPNNLNMPYQLIGGMQGLIKQNNQPNTNPYSM